MPDHGNRLRFLARWDRNRQQVISTFKTSRAGIPLRRIRGRTMANRSRDYLENIHLEDASLDCLTHFGPGARSTANAAKEKGPA